MVVFLQEPENRTSYVDLVALDGTVGPAYEASIDCSLSFGSIRSLTNCTTVISDIEFIPFAFVMKCEEYASNSVNGSTLISTEDLWTDETCECDCGASDPFDTLVAPESGYEARTAPDGSCPCYCTAGRGDCVCLPPFEDTFVENWNELYKNKTDFVGENVTVFNVTEPEVIEGCGVPYITYNTTTICLPSTKTEVPVVASTDAPSAEPTKMPTKKPTKRPTRRPTKRPTRRPTKRPTRKPTRRPSAHPTDYPTYIPTDFPTPWSCPKKNCCDDPNFRIGGFKNLDCDWLGETIVRVDNQCDKPDVQKGCPVTCSAATSAICIDNPCYRIGGFKNLSCEWLGENAARIANQCAKTEVQEGCPLTCSICTPPTPPTP
jgi:hypothetical protein